MKRKKLIINALILTIVTMSLGFINMGFRVYLSKKIGAEGMGLFQLIMSVYLMASTICISGIRVTTTRLIAEELGKSNSNNIKLIMKNAFVYSFFFSLLMFFIMYYGAEFISNEWIKDERAIIPLKILACCMPSIGIGACFHGYFYGVRKVIKSISGDLIESFTMMFIIIYFMSISLPKGLEYTCALICVGMSVGNIFCAVYFYILFLFEKNGKNNVSRNNTYNFPKIFSISFPIACSSYIQIGLKTAEDILIPTALRKFGTSSSSALTIFGIIKGMALPILAFPSIFLASFSTLIIPEIAEANALNNKVRVNYIISKVFKFTLLIAIFSTGLFMIFSKELGIGIYNNSQVGIMMKILAPLIPFMYLDRIVDGSLNALDKQMYTLKFNLIDMGIRIFLILYLIPKKGIEGFIIVLFAGTLLNSILSINKLLKVTKLEFLFIDWIIIPSICISLSGFLIKTLLVSLNTNLVLLVLVNLFFYTIFLVLFKCIKKKDFMWFVDAFRYGFVCDDFYKIYKKI